MKIGLLITARLKSSRLPMKLLLDMNGRTIIERVIDRCKQLHEVDDIVICTSTNNQDRPLTDIALKNNVHYFLGDEEDVLKRLLDAGKFFQHDYILCITGENPLFSIEYAQRVINDIKSHQNDFTYYDGLPIGCAVYGLKLKALEVVCNIKKEVDTEIWGPLVNRPELFSISKGSVEPFFNRPNLRITNDYLDDYRFNQALHSHFKPESVPSLLAALEVLDQHPHYLNIHGHLVQKSIDPNQLERINTFFKNNLTELKAIKNKIYAS